MSKLQKKAAMWTTNEVDFDPTLNTGKKQLA